MPEISIVLPTYNGEKYIRESIDSILAQTFTDWELIIVDDCSTDLTSEIIYEYAGRDNRVRIIHNKKNLKLPASLNVGFRAAKGKFYTWTSDDNVYETKALEIMHKVLSEEVDVPMVVADMIAIDEHGNYLNDWVIYSKSGMARNNVVGACFLYRNQVEKSIGDYNEKLFLLEDYDYWIRVLLECGDIIRIPQKLYRYRVHANSLSEVRLSDIQSRLKNYRKTNQEKLFELCQFDQLKLLDLYIELEATGLTSHRMSELVNENVLCPGKALYVKGAKVALYGAGEYGKRLLKVLSNVAYYVDNDDRKHGQKIEGINVISLKDYFAIQDTITLVVAVSQYNMISALVDINNAGIKQCCLYFDVLRELGIKEELISND